jgi:hypothetical protein
VIDWILTTATTVVGALGAEGEDDPQAYKSDARATATAHATRFFMRTSPENSGGSARIIEYDCPHVKAIHTSSLKSLIRKTFPVPVAEYGMTRTRTFRLGPLRHAKAFIASAFGGDRGVENRSA